MSKKKYTDVFKSGGKILGQSASKAFKYRLYIIKFSHFKALHKHRKEKYLFFCNFCSDFASYITTFRGYLGTILKTLTKKHNKINEIHLPKITHIMAALNIKPSNKIKT